jgi:phosphoglycolate phosphatase-like HAD superfamily hydrolase
MTPVRSRIKVVAFDCDGVMFDTVESNKVYYNGILSHFNKPLLTPSQFDFVHMSTVKEAILFLFQDDHRIDEVFAYCREMSYDPLIPHMTIEPGLKSLLNLLRPRFKTAIATNRSTTMGSVMKYHGLTDLFDMVVTSMDVENPKPHPEQLFKIMERFRAIPDEVLYIGDSRTDEQAAMGAGVVFAAYRNPTLAARYHVRDLCEIKTILASDDSSESVDL